MRGWRAVAAAGVAACAAMAACPTRGAEAAAADGPYLRPGDVVLVIGDAVAVDGGFVRQAFAALAGEHPQLAGARGVTFVNEARAGESSADALGRLPGIVASRRPTVAVVCYGTADAIAGRTGTAENVRAILQALRASSIAATVVTPACVQGAGYPELATCASALEQTARELVPVSAAAGAVLVDCCAATRARAGGADLSWGDGVHPNEEGMRVMAAALADAWRSAGARAREQVARPRLVPGGLDVEPRVSSFRHLGGGRFEITYAWVVGETPAASWGCFVHFFSAVHGGNAGIVFQHDHKLQPAIDTWRPGTVVEDGPHALGIAGAYDSYDILVGLSNGKDRARLRGDDDGQMRFRIGRLKVVRAGGAVERVELLRPGAY